MNIISQARYSRRGQVVRPKLDLPYLQDMRAFCKAGRLPVVHGKKCDAKSICVDLAGS
jgi:hypothetical protein